MQNIYVLNDSVIFWPDRNLLSCVSDSSKKVQLTGPSARCLELLLSRKDLVLQNDFYEYAWQGSGFIPSPNTLYQSISVIRRAFRELCKNETDYILTETRKGFRLNPTVTVLAKMQDFNEDESEKNVSRVDAREQTVAPYNYQNRKLIRFTIMAFILIMIVISGTITFELYGAQTRGYSFFKKYSGPVFMPGSTCKFFLSPKNGKDRLSILNLSFLKCQHQYFVYVTILPYSPDISVISCDKAIDLRPKKCEVMDLREENVF